MSSYHTRPMLATDIAAVTDIVAAAHLDDPAFAVAWPRARQYPDLWRRTWSRLIRSDFYSPATHVRIAVHRDAATGAETPAGAAFWYRTGPASSATARAYASGKNTWTDAFERAAVALELRYAAALRLEDVATAPAVDAAWQAASLACRQRWEPRYPERWHLKGLAVGPEHQRRGLGTRLLGWGMERAEDEGVPATLFAAPLGQALYERHGFVAVDWCVSEDGQMEFDPMLVREGPNLRPGIPRLAGMEDVQAFWAAGKKRGERVRTNTETAA